MTPPLSPELLQLFSGGVIQWNSLGRWLQCVEHIFVPVQPGLGYDFWVAVSARGQGEDSISMWVWRDRNVYIKLMLAEINWKIPEDSGDHCSHLAPTPKLTASRWIGRSSSPDCSVPLSPAPAETQRHGSDERYVQFDCRARSQFVRRKATI